MRIRIFGIPVHISILLLAVPPFLWVVGAWKEYAAAFVSIALHELGHLAVARLCGCDAVMIRILPVGLSVSFRDGDCPRQAAIKIYSAGPAVNLLILLAAFLAASAIPKATAFLEPVAEINAYLALFNLIPAFPLDGGRILMELLAGKVGLLAAGKLTGRLALVLSAVLLAVGLLQLYVSGYNFSLIVIGLYIVILWKNGKMESALMNIRQIVYRHSRFLKKGIYPARELVVLPDTRLDETLKNMDFDRFHLIYLLNDDLSLLRIYTEYEILEAVEKMGAVTFGHLWGLTGAQQKD